MLGRKTPLAETPLEARHKADLKASRFDFPGELGPNREAETPLFDPATFNTPDPLILDQPDAQITSDHFIDRNAVATSDRLQTGTDETLPQRQPAGTTFPILQAPLQPQRFLQAPLSFHRGKDQENSQKPLLEPEEESPDVSPTGEGGGSSTHK
jgi:hypothetical protein